MITKKRALKEIKEFRKVFNKIEPSQFYFDEFVSEYNKDHTCATICCLWGWIPQIAPKIAAKYDIHYDFFSITNMSKNPHILPWPGKMRSYLFYPNICWLDFEILSTSAELSEVLKAWDNVIDTLENTKKLDHLF